MVDWLHQTNKVDYQTAVMEMERRIENIRLKAENEAVWLIEHPPLYTSGTSAKAEDIKNPRFPVYETGRGGQYTYHGPGQRVAYVMLDLKKRQHEPDIKKYVWQLEEWIIQTLATFSINGERREGRIGIWVQQDNSEKKIAAIGVRVRHWVTYHGISINVSPDLTHFDEIIPCGIKEFGVTRLADLRPDITMKDVDTALKNTFDSVFDTPVTP